MVNKYLYIVAGLLLSGCAAVVPQTLHTPLLTQRGQAEIVAATGLHGTGLQVAYAATDNVVLTASGQQRIRGAKGHWAYAGEAGVGRLWHRTESHHWAVYGGLGYGAGRATSGNDFCIDLCSDTYYRDRVRYVYAYVQPTYALIEGSYGLSAALKISPYYYTRWLDTRYELDNLNMPDPYTQDRSGQVVTTLQPGINFYFGLGSRWRFLVTGSAQIPLGLAPPTAVLATGFGIQLRLGPQRK